MFIGFREHFPLFEHFVIQPVKSWLDTLSRKFNVSIFSLDIKLSKFRFISIGLVDVDASAVESEFWDEIVDRLVVWSILDKNEYWTVKFGNVENSEFVVSSVESDKSSFLVDTEGTFVVETSKRIFNFN